jgi:hypothetical protein
VPAALLDGWIRADLNGRLSSRRGADT